MKNQTSTYSLSWIAWTITPLKWIAQAKLPASYPLRYGVSISRAFLSEKEWGDGDSAFVQNVREEAIPA